MLYLIPAWYQKDSFSEVEQYWYRRRLRSEFDDTVKQVQLFNRSGAYPYRIMLLGFAPNFRHFLHRQSVFHAPYWSCFDAIQEIARKRAAVLSYHNLEWPEGVEFDYTPFAICARLNGQKYAQIEFGEDGNLIEIDMFENNRLKRRNIYDDRGFVSATVLFDADAKPLYQDYLNEKGIWKIRYYYNDGHVRVNEKIPTYRIEQANREITVDFARNEYSSMDDILYEVLSKYLEYTNGDDIFCAACHHRHGSILKRAFEGKKFVLSFFEDRYIPQEDDGTYELYKAARHFIVDSEANFARINAVSETFKDRITDITPYDSRVSFGISQQLEVQNILVPVDGLAEPVLVELIKIFDKYVNSNKNARVHFFTRSANDIVVKMVDALITENIVDDIFGNDENPEPTVCETGIDMIGEKRKKNLFFIEQCVDELAVSKCMREQRIIVDVRQMPELFLQISAISGGIPQIVRYQTQYVTHGKNGHVVEALSELPAALDYYLLNLNNWNAAKIFSYELGKKYTSSVLLKRWKEVISSLG